jgi:hypothetical protein
VFQVSILYKRILSFGTATLAFFKMNILILQNNACKVYEPIIPGGWNLITDEQLMRV